MQDLCEETIAFLEKKAKRTHPCDEKLYRFAITNIRAMQEISDEITDLISDGLSDEQTQVLCCVLDIIEKATSL